MMTLPLHPAYRAAVKAALALQIPLTVLLLLILDGGRLAKIGGCAMIGFWLGAAVILLRRPLAPRMTDVVYLRAGYLVLLFVAITMAAWIVPL